VGPSELSHTASLKCGDKIKIGDLGHSFEVRVSFEVAPFVPTGTIDGGTSTRSSMAASADHSFGVRVLAPNEQATAIGVSGDQAQFYVDKTRSTLRNATPPVFKDIHHDCALAQVHSGTLNPYRYFHHRNWSKNQVLSPFAIQASGSVPPG
jgi:hypothetical protein